MRPFTRLSIAVAIVGSTLSLAQPIAAGNPTPDIVGGIAVNPVATLPGTTVQATGSFTNVGGPASWQIGLRLEGTNGAGTFTAVTPGPGVTNCSIDTPVARTVTCDWNPTMVNEATTVTATINVDPSASPLPNIWDVLAKEGDRTLATSTLEILATYSGTVEGLCQGADQPVIRATNTGTGDLTFVAAGTGFPLPAGQGITVQWPSDQSGPLPQVDWELRIPGTEDSVESGTLALPDCSSTPPTTTPPTTTPPITTPPITTPPTTPAPTTALPGPALPKTGPANWWIAVTGVGFVLLGAVLSTVRRRPN